ncbi:MAG: SdpI family protein [Tepidisphaeraceae bacterium]
MDVVAIIIGVSCLGIAAGLIGISIPLVQGKVRPNRFYGVRLKASFASDEAWYAINRFGGQQLIFWSGPIIAIGLAAFFLPLKANPIAALLVGFSPVVFILIATIRIIGFAERFGSDR